MKENSLTILYICHFISHSFFQFPGMYLVDICLFWVGVFWLLGKKKKPHHCSIDLEWCMRQIRSVWDVATDQSRHYIKHIWEEGHLGLGRCAWGMCLIETELSQKEWSLLERNIRSAIFVKAWTLQRISPHSAPIWCGDRLTWMASRGSLPRWVSWPTWALWM